MIKKESPEKIKNKDKKEKPILRINRAELEENIKKAMETSKNLENSIGKILSEINHLKEENKKMNIVR